MVVVVVVVLVLVMVGPLLVHEQPDRQTDQACMYVCITLKFIEAKVGR
jgi:hypothetical protein